MSPPSLPRAKDTFQQCAQQRKNIAKKKRLNMFNVQNVFDQVCKHDGSMRTALQEGGVEALEPSSPVRCRPPHVEDPLPTFRSSTTAAAITTTTSATFCCSGIGSGSGAGAGAAFRLLALPQQRRDGDRSRHRVANHP